MARLPWYACVVPPQQRKRRDPDSPSGSSARVCKALTTAGQPCKRVAVTGLTVCLSHGGGTVASVQVGKRASVSQQAAVLWGISPDTGNLSVAEELTKLARNKLTDILAIRLEVGSNPTKYYGMLLDSREVTEAEVGEEIYVTSKRRHVMGTHPLVSELHKTESELMQVLRLLQEVTGGTEELDTRRIRMQTAREAARLLKAFPGISVDEVALEVSKQAS